MSKLSISPAILAVLVCALWPGAYGADTDSNDQPADSLTESSLPASPWPAQISADGRTLVVYPPQFDTWQGSRLEGRAAVSVQTSGVEQPSFGVLWISARADVDQAGGMVTVRDLAVSNAEFPTATSASGDYLGPLREQLAAMSWQIPVERLQSDMAIDRAVRQAAGQPLKNDPPRILYSERPAILVPIDGAPVLREVPGTRVRRIVNTRALILQDQAAVRYYLYVTNHWMEAQNLEGPWSSAVNPSADLEQAKQIAVQQDQVDLLDDQGDEGRTLGQSPVIYVSTAPAELLQTNGPPQYAPIERTQLLYVTNSPNRIFLDLKTQTHYVLISGRWYRARALAQGSWEYVPARSLPGDFAMIPPDHPAEAVRAAVPGTPQAREAAIANSVPQVATVKRSAARLEIAYDGEPTFVPIESTSLQSAINSPIPVIRVGEESYYALDNGVWFVASTPFGPWSAASYVPPVIYSIPRSSPLHYVTYVRIYDSTPEAVYVGYTPGYVGSYVSSEDVVVYGTGWPYRPWIGSVWYGPPVTWGYGFSFVYTWWNPWRPRWAFGLAPFPRFRPWWGPWFFPVFHSRPHFAVAPAIVIGNINRAHPRSFGVANIYGRWGHNAVAWNRPNSPAARRAVPLLAHGAPGHGFASGADGRWRSIGDRNDWRDSTSRQAGAINRLPSIQTPRWRAGPTTAPMNTQAVTPHTLPRIQTPFVARSRPMPDETRQRSTPERVFTQRPGVDRAQPPVGVRPERREFVEPPRARTPQDRRAFAAPSDRVAPLMSPAERAARVPMQRAMPAPRESGAAPGGHVQREFGAGGGRREARAHGAEGEGRRNMGWGRSESRSGGWRH